jgi:hypothetical protein
MWTITMIGRKALCGLYELARYVRCDPIYGCFDETAAAREAPGSGGNGIGKCLFRHAGVFRVAVEKDFEYRLSTKRFKLSILLDDPLHLVLRSFPRCSKGYFADFA